MLEIVTRPIEAWPGELRTPAQRETARFTAQWSDTRAKLDLELRALKARQIVMQIAIRPEDLRIDGEIRANARPAAHPGVILAFESMHGPLKYATDLYDRGGYRREGSLPGWQCNVRAIALGLEALRKVDRYGITKRGEQYTGWSALPSGMAMSAGLTISEAAAILARESGEPADGGDIELEPGVIDDAMVRRLYKAAAKLHHPDTGGDPQVWDAVESAYRRLTDEGA